MNRDVKCHFSEYKLRLFKYGPRRFPTPFPSFLCYPTKDRLLWLLGAFIYHTRPDNFLSPPWLAATTGSCIRLAHPGLSSFGARAGTYACTCDTFLTLRLRLPFSPASCCWAFQSRSLRLRGEGRTTATYTHCRQIGPYQDTELPSGPA